MYNTKIFHGDGGDSLTIGNGGELKLSAGSVVSTSGDITMSGAPSIASYIPRVMVWSAAQAVAADTDAVLDGVALTDEAQTVTTGIGALPCARNVTVVGTAAGMAGAVTVTGTNMYGAAISEAFTLNGTTAQTGTKAFATITSIALPVLTTAGDTVDVGYGYVLGLPCKVKNVVSARIGATSKTVTLATSANIESCTALLSTNLSGAETEIVGLA